MSLHEIIEESELASALAEEHFLLFKHSRTCPTSAFAFAEYKQFLEKDPGVSTAWLDVVARRPLSQGVAADTGVRHESPQALLFHRGQVVWHASHGAITVSSLGQALQDQSGLSSSK